jgi:hypothetical protein
LILTAVLFGILILYVHNQFEEKLVKKNSLWNNIQKLHNLKV